MDSKNNSVLKKSNKQKKKIRGRPPDSEPNFPSFSLKRALGISEVMAKSYEGDPTDPIDIANQLQQRPQSKTFKNLLVASSRYGLTKGSYKSEKISLTDLGRSIVEPTSDEEKNTGVLNALTKPPIFKQMIDRYNRKNFPKKDIIRNIIKNDLKVPSDRAGKCTNILIANIGDYGLIDKANNMLRVSITNVQKDPDDRLSEENPSSESTGVELGGNTKQDKFTTTDSNDANATKEKSLAVFISHSKNTKILNQIKEILNTGQIKHMVAEEIETAAIPIPDKIFGIMRDCNSAIINISADEEMKQENGEYKINENVLIEIGGAFVHYDKRVILLVDERLKLPSNLQGIYRCNYTGDELSLSVGIKIQKVLVGFKKSLHESISFIH